MSFGVSVFFYSGEGEGEIVSLFPLLCSVFCVYTQYGTIPHTHTHTHIKKKNSCTMHYSGWFFYYMYSSYFTPAFLNFEYYQNLLLSCQRRPPLLMRSCFFVTLLPTPFSISLSTTLSTTNSTDIFFPFFFKLCVFSL